METVVASQPKIDLAREDLRVRVRHGDVAVVLTNLDLLKAELAQASAEELLNFGNVSRVKELKRQTEDVLETPSGTLVAKFDQQLGIGKEGGKAVILAQGPLAAALKQMFGTLFQNPGITAESIEAAASLGGKTTVIDIVPAYDWSYKAQEAMRRGMNYIMYGFPVDILNLGYLAQKITGVKRETSAAPGMIARDLPTLTTCFSTLRSNHSEPLMVVNQRVVAEAAEQARQRLIRPVENLWTPQRGFLREYQTAELLEFLNNPGTRLTLAWSGNQLLGTVFYMTDSKAFIGRAALLHEALRINGEPLPGKVGYGHLINVTPSGEEYGRSRKISVCDLLTDMLKAEMRAAGVRTVIAECRGFPFPNQEALRRHQQHGWKLTDTWVLSPFGIVNGRACNTLAQVLRLDLGADGA